MAWCPLKLQRENCAVANLQRSKPLRRHKGPVGSQVFCLGLEMGSEVPRFRLFFGKRTAKLNKIWRRDLGGLWLPQWAIRESPEGVDRRQGGRLPLAAILSEWRDLGHSVSFPRIFLYKKTGFPAENPSKTWFLSIRYSYIVPI